MRFFNHLKCLTKIKTQNFENKNEITWLEWNARKKVEKKIRMHFSFLL